MSRPIKTAPLMSKSANPEPIPGLASHLRDSLHALRNGHLRIRQITEAYEASLRLARSGFSNSRELTAEGRDRAMQRARGPIVAKAVADLATAREELYGEHTKIIANLERRWPKPATGLEALMSRQAAWARCRSLLESKALTPDQLLAETTDIETLHALRDELPTWMRTRDHVSGRASQRDVDRRLAELAGEVTTAAYQAAVEADAERAGLEPLFTYTTRMLQGEADQVERMNSAYQASAARKTSLGGTTSPAPAA